MKHLRLDHLAGQSLADYAATDAEWFHEAYTVLSRYQQGVQARQQIDAGRRQMQA